jgi:hypothetical protein
MLDYSGDFDVAMQTAGSSADTWLYTGESVMDQDAHHDSQSLGAADTESVEVDMAEYLDADHESVEYEMADEEHAYQPESGDLLDVEVYDASQAHSPLPIPAIDAQTATNDIVDYSIQPPHVLSDTLDIARPDHPPVVDGDAFAPSNYEFADNAPTSSHHFEVHEEVLDAAVASTDSHSEHPVESSTLVQPVVADEAVFPYSPSSEAVVDVTEPVEKGVVHVVAHGEAPPVTRGDEAEPEIHTPHPQDHEAVTHPVQPHESADAAERYESAEHHDEVEQYQEYNEVVASATDPHEISEGVYIDPPPAVLLSLPLSDGAEICLFNQPRARAGSSSPTEETYQHDRQTFPVLLHHRPTLYYEPLTNVFEALRQEEYIARIPDFIEGELALDAYDLQLVVSEDNAHARDVTLHDLNVLHDGSDLSGPLRLHLHVVVPRFILRYHMLRDQIARLNLVVDGGEIEPNATRGNNYDENGVVYQQEDSLPGENPQESEDNPEQQSPGETDGHADLPPDSALSTEQINEATGDISNLTAEDHDYHQARGDEAQALEDGNEYADADTVAEGREESTSLDGDLAAARLGHAQPTEYEEYVEEEGYDQRYGETLLEDDGAENDPPLEYLEATEHQEATAVDEAQEATPGANGIEDSDAFDLVEPEREVEHAPEEVHSTSGSAAGGQLCDLLLIYC